MTRADKLAWDHWADTHILTKVIFGWNDIEMTSKDCTYNQALTVAESIGYREPRWYKPWTWLNWVVTVG